MVSVDLVRATRIATADATSITVRGHDLVNDLLGRFSFTEMIYFLATGAEPNAQQVRVLDACLVVLAEHGFNPSSLIARLMADSVPGEIQVAMGAGLMAVGSVFAGTMEGCAALLVSDPAVPLQEWAARTVAEHRAAGRPIPGFGHATHKPDDPRSPRLLAIAEDANVARHYVPRLCALASEVDAAYGRHITINATGAIAALLLEIDFPPTALRGVAVLSRAAGLLGHVLEEHATRSARQTVTLVRKHFPYSVE